MEDKRIEAIKFLIADEVEAIDGYVKKRKYLTKADLVKVDEIILDETKHIDILKGMIGEK